MTPIAGPLRQLAAEIAALSADHGRRVELDVPALTERTGHLALAPPGLWSPNRACRLARAADGWIVVNLAREADLDLIPAWLGEAPDDPWPTVLACVRRRPWRELVAGARLLGLPVAGVGEISAETMDAPLVAAGRPAASPLRAQTVVDLSSLWAGPLCGQVLVRLGAVVTKVESARRPDPSRSSTPGFFRQLNAGKAELALDFTADADRARLRELILTADVLITSARPRAFEQLGLAPAAVFAERPQLVWVAVSGYGWTGGQADRVAFGDDSAAAGGLVSWTGRGPRFLGDALGDPLTGLAAAAGALRALAAGGGAIVDAAMARTSAGAATALGLARAA
jgi:hypothetical protein